MRVSSTLLACSMLLGAASAGAATLQSGKTPVASSASNCPRTTSYVADQSGVYRSEPLRPRKLTELPPGTTYMAVYRRIGGCDAPLTMAEYRKARNR